MPRRNLFAIVMVGALSLLCWQVSQGARQKDDVTELYGLFVDAMEQVQSNYVRPVTRKELVESALKGMLQDLDPHSQFINTSQWRSFRRQIEGRFAGVGMTVGMDPDLDRLKVIAPMVGTPAYEAGVMAGDLITAIDGKSTEGMTPDKAVEVLQGQPGTPVKLTVMHEGSDKTEDLTLTRALIDMPSVLGDQRRSNDQWDFMLNKDKKIGYVRITNFVETTAAELRKAVDDLKQEGMKGLIIDLRDNPGGLLTAAVEISDMFVKKGKIVSTKGRNTAEKVYDAHDDGNEGDYPMVVLVNENSASASEIVSACLQDHKRATVIGQRSFGKGSVQSILELDDGQSVLKLTVATYFRPSNKNIHKFKGMKDSDEWGVSPDKGFDVPLNRSQYISWALSRRDRDYQTGSRKLIAPKPKPKDAAKAKDKEKDAKPANPHAESKPFSDKALDKAVEVISSKLSK